MNGILKDVNVDSKTLYERQSVKSKHICEERYKGGDYGFPMYHTGFVTDKCSYGVPVSKLVTVIKYIASASDKETLLTKLDGLIASINSVMKDSNILIAVNFQSFSNDLEKKYKGVKVSFSNYKCEGSALNSLVKDIKTPYVLVARQIDTFTNDSRLERLVREIESLDVAAVSGAFREPNGHWRQGCFQSVYRNYTLEYIEGYDESFHECLFCDYIQGPFLTTAKYLEQNKFQNMDENDGLYEDWFLRITQSGRETIVCPDSMFFVENQTSKSVSKWKEFSEYWGVFKIISPRGETIIRSCENSKFGIKPTLVLSPCALHNYNEAIKHFMQICDESGAICELQEGTALGAVKLGQNIPWDIDFDLRFSLANCSKCQQLENAYKKAGIKIQHFSSKCCPNKLKLGERVNFGVNYKGSNGDFTGHPVMDSEVLVKNGIAPSKVLFHGQWVNLPRNPGMFMRNRYGRELYRHAEHWRHTKEKVFRPNYTTNFFMPCKVPGAHNCLDKYNADGNLPFRIMLP